MANLVSMAGSLGFACRALKLDIKQMRQLNLPCILHWDMNHFVVLKKLHRSGAVIHDPARGVRQMSIEQLSTHFTGVALEISPTSDFSPQEMRVQARLSDLWTSIVGWQRALVQTLLLSALLQLFVLAAPSYLRLVIDDAVTRLDEQFLAILAVSFALMYVIQAATEALRSWVILQVGQVIGFQMIGNVLHHLLRLPTSFFEKRFVGDILSRVGSVKPIQEVLTQSVVTTLIDGVMAIATASLIFVYSPLLGFITLGSVALYFAIVLGLYPRRRLHEEEQLYATAESQSYLIESIRASKTIKLFGREAQREVVWRNYFAHVVNAALGSGKLQIASQSARTLLFGLQLVAVVYFAALLVMRGELTAGALIAVLLYRDNFTSRADALAQRVVEFRLLRLHLERLADIIQTQREAELDEPRLQLAEIAGSMSLRNVSFRYADNEPFVLHDISLDIAPGDFLAIVGASGGGKTTLLKIMLGLLPASDGQVLVEGQSMRSVGIQQWRSQIGVVQQDDQLMAGTIADNICCFDAHLDMGRVMESAKAASVDGEIRAMPMGYLSLVGDMGSTLSGGQRQRVLLARALYRQPKLLFLDEGTANLDVGAEACIADLIERLPITRIVIAHRPELVMRAHRVVELRQGRLHELVMQNEPAAIPEHG